MCCLSDWKERLLMTAKLPDILRKRKSPNIFREIAPVLSNQKTMQEKHTQPEAVVQKHKQHVHHGQHHGQHLPATLFKHDYRRTVVDTAVPTTGVEHVQNTEPMF